MNLMQFKRKQDTSFTISSLHRSRWNVLDLISVVGQDVVGTHLLEEIDMTWAEELRARLSLEGHKLTVTVILLKAIAIAQRCHPASRSVLLPGGRIATFSNVVAGFTIERLTSSEPAVFFGTIQEPDKKSLSVIMSELRQYAELNIDDHPQLNRQQKFSEMPWLIRRVFIWLAMRLPAFRQRYLGATFGLSSLGKFGVKSLLGPPVCTVVFGVGAVEDRAVVRNGQIEIRPIMTLSLNFDHRLIDGAPAARFLADVRELMEGMLDQYLQKETDVKALVA